MNVSIGFKSNPSNGATFVQSTRTQRFCDNHLNIVMLVFIGQLSLRTHVLGFRSFFFKSCFPYFCIGQISHWHSSVHVYVRIVMRIFTRIGVYIYPLMLAVAKSRRYLLLLAVSHQLGSIPTGTCEKVASDLWLCDGFRRVLLHQLQSASHDWQKKWRKSKFQNSHCSKLP